MLINFVIGASIMLLTGIMTMLIVKALRNFYMNPDYASAKMFLDDSSKRALKFAVMSLVLYGTIAFIAGIAIFADLLPQSSIYRRELPATLALVVIAAATNFFHVIGSVTEKED